MTDKPTKNPAAVSLGSLGGKARSEAKAKSSKENGKKGGRPRKLKSGSGEAGDGLTMVYYPKVTINTIGGAGSWKGHEKGAGGNGR